MFFKSASLPSLNPTKSIGAHSKNTKNRDFANAMYVHIVNRADERKEKGC